MVTNRQIINNFLVSYTENKLNIVNQILDENCIYISSNIGFVQGKENITEALHWKYDFDICHVTTTNRMEYDEDNYHYEALMAHHMVAYEKYNQLYPFVFGGKYEFKVNTLTNKIEKIVFVLEYQAENTIYVKDLWKLSNGMNDYTKLFFDFSKLDNTIENKVNAFFYCLDTKNIPYIQSICSQDFEISRDYSVGEGKYISNIQHIDQYMDDTNSYFDLNQNSVRINSIHNGTVQAQHLTPHRLGTKKLNSLTKYHSFFDEDITIQYDVETLQLRSIVMKKAADVYYNGFSILEY